MIISLALLGYGGSGTFLALLRRYLLSQFHLAYLANLLLFAVASIACFQISQIIPFNPAEFLWDGGQILQLTMVFLILAVPFFFAANSIGLALMKFGSHTPSIYSADLIGAGLGAISIVLILFGVFPHTALRIVFGLGVAATLIGCLELKHKQTFWFTTSLFCLIGALLIPTHSIKPRSIAYKGLTQALQIHGTSIVEERSSPLSLLTLVDSKKIPFRHTPGLSLRSDQTPPDQLGLFIDGDNMTAINRFDGNFEPLEFLNQSSFALPYYLGHPKQVLIIGAGGGAGVLLAKRHKAERINAVELNPQIVELIAGNLADFTGDLYNSDDVDIHIGDGRAFVRQTEKHFDLIEVTLLDSFNASSAGLYALNESYLYTVEAIGEFISHLTSDGYLAVSRWIKMPPRDSLKLFAIAYAALKQSNIENAENHLLLIRGWQTSTLIVKKSEYNEYELASLKKFCQRFNFDVVYYPGIKSSEANRFNIFAAPYFYQGARAIVSGQASQQQFFNDYKFDIHPATDDKPYFFHFFKWQTLPELLKLVKSGGISLLESTYMVLAATLILAFGMSVLFILLPLYFFRFDLGKTARPFALTRVCTYFSCLGLAFLFIEIAFIQKFLLFLHHPLYSIAVVLSAFLVAAGLGSRLSSKFVSNDNFRDMLWKAVTPIVVISSVYLYILPILFVESSGLTEINKILLSIALIAPLGVFMGIPFPLALSKLSQTAPQFVPWAWGINGCASVIGAILGTLIAIAVGFNALILVALVLYLLAALTFPGSTISKVAIANNTFNN